MVKMRRKFWKNTFLAIKANYISMIGFGTIYRLAPLVAFALLCISLSAIPGSSDLPAISQEILSKPTFLETSGHLAKLVYIFPDSTMKWVTIASGVAVNFLATGLLQAGILNFILGGFTCVDLSQEFASGIAKKGIRMVGYQTQVFPIILAIQGIAATLSLLLPLVAKSGSPWAVFLFEMIIFAVVCIIRTPLLLAPFYYFKGQSFTESILASARLVWPWYAELLLVHLILGFLCGLLGVIVSLAPQQFGLEKILSIFLSLVTWSAFTFSLVATASAFKIISEEQPAENAALQLKGVS